MHIPEAMLNGGICPVTAAVCAGGVALAAVAAVRTANKPAAARFGAVTALIFAGQMMNFPIADGTSGHLLGGVLAASVLGTPFGVLAVALVVTLQALVFADGGLSVLGANILNMALLGAGAGGLARSFLLRRGFNPLMATALAAWGSVMLAATGVSAELGVSGQIAFSRVLPAMLSVHALIGVGEALISVLAVATLTSPTRASAGSSAVAPLTAAGVIALALSPFASPLPDGLEWVAQKYAFLHDSAPRFVAPLPDYTVPVISNEALSTGLAGLAGVALCFAVAWGLARLLTGRSVASAA